MGLAPQIKNLFRPLPLTYVWLRGKQQQHNDPNYNSNRLDILQVIDEIYVFFFVHHQVGLDRAQIFLSSYDVISLFK